MVEQESDCWVVRLTPHAGGSVMDLLMRPMSLDVWERHPDCLVAAASERTIAEIERRRLAQVDRIRRTTDLEKDARAGARARSGVQDA